jgi:hypothetical protein
MVHAQYCSCLINFTVIKHNSTISFTFSVKNIDPFGVNHPEVKAVSRKKITTINVGILCQKS